MDGETENHPGSQVPECWQWGCLTAQGYRVQEARCQTHETYQTLLGLIFPELCLI